MVRRFLRWWRGTELTRLEALRLIVGKPLDERVMRFGEYVTQRRFPKL